MRLWCVRLNHRVGVGTPPCPAGREGRGHEGAGGGGAGKPRRGRSTAQHLKLKHLTFARLPEVLRDAGVEPTLFITSGIAL